jgi:hypothetical protein
MRMIARDGERESRWRRIHAEGMRTLLTRLRRQRDLVIASILLICGPAQMALAVDYWLAVRQTDGNDRFYAVDEIHRITHGATDLYVTTTAGPDPFALEGIGRIDFVPESTMAGVDRRADQPADMEALRLAQNHPNPSSSETQIAFDLPLDGCARLRIYDVSGRLIRTLVNETYPAGLHSVRWDGLDETGRAVACGVYFYSLTAPGVDESRRMIVVK